MDINIWKQRVRQAVEGLADAECQRRAWFGIGPEESSPTEEVCQLVDDTDFEDHLDKNDVEFNQNQIEAGKNLLTAVKQCPYAIRNSVKPEILVNRIG
jgi:hypothetical protein